MCHSKPQVGAGIIGIRIDVDDIFCWWLFLFLFLLLLWLKFAGFIVTWLALEGGID